MGDGWRMVIACPDGTTQTVGVALWDNNGSWRRNARLRVNSDSNGPVTCAGFGDTDMDAMADAVTSLAGYCHIVRELVPPGAQTADERIAAARAEVWEACAGIARERAALASERRRLCAEAGLPHSHDARYSEAGAIELMIRARGEAERG